MAVSASSGFWFPEFTDLQVYMSACFDVFLTSSLARIYLFLLVSVVLLLNLLIAQLNQTYEYINKDQLIILCHRLLVVGAAAFTPHLQ